MGQRYRDERLARELILLWGLGGCQGIAGSTPLACRPVGLSKQAGIRLASIEFVDTIQPANHLEGRRAVKAISIQQPWAWAIVHAGKDIENRTWTTTHRGELAIHATRLQEGYQLPRGVEAPPADDMALGAVIGV